MSIPNVCAVPVIAPKVKGFFIVGIIAVVKTIAIASPIPKSKRLEELCNKC